MPAVTVRVVDVVELHQHRAICISHADSPFSGSFVTDTDVNAKAIGLEICQAWGLSHLR